jgi:glycine C-acetyltransferase
VRFICGTQQIHKELEAAIADYLGFEDSILFAAAFDANGGVFEPLLGEDDAIVSDSLNHASIIDGVRLCKAKRYRFATSDMHDLEAKLKEAKAAGAKTIVIATDGAFSMDGFIAKLDEITSWPTRFDALVLVDDCHATGFLGPQGRGSAAYRGVEGRIDILTGTFGKALGGAMGGFVAPRDRSWPCCASGRGPISSPTRSRRRSAAPAWRPSASPVGRGRRPARPPDRQCGQFRAGMEAPASPCWPGEHPIVPVMLGDARLAQDMAARLLDAGVYVIGFSYPVVPKGEARIRTQMSAAHTKRHVDRHRGLQGRSSIGIDFMNHASAWPNPPAAKACG